MHISQIVFRAAQQRGTAEAIEYQGNVRNWTQTEQRMCAMAGALAQQGLGINDKVAILSLNSDVYLESLFAIPHMGGVMVPLNTRWALPEFQYPLSDSDSKGLLFDSNFIAVVEQLRSEDTAIEHYFYMGAAEDCPAWAQCLESLMQEAEPLLDSVLADRELAGIFYTGGTTGYPKGVMQSHVALFTSGLSLAAASNADENRTVLHCAPMFHMADLATVFMYSILGSKHVIVPAFEPLAVIDAIAELGVSDTLMVPAMLQMMLDHPEFDAGKLQGLKALLYGASPMPEGLLRKILTTLPNLEITQAYGQTEMAPLITILSAEDHRAAIRGDEKSARLLRSAGKSGYSVQIKTVDEQGKTLPLGSVGEICTRGPNAMSGYWNKPEQTAAALKDNWVHTGDAGYIDEEGYLFIVDRVKDMIVTGGENVFSSEVESALSTHPAVAQVAVVGIPHDDWGEAVHAIVVARPGVACTEADIIAHAREKIAHYKCPKSVSFRDEPLPHSGAGKVLKRELRAPYWEGRERQVN
ncbi:acyl-CoA synthetase (AMP-forming)/AMP-acid ligase II [Zhongshania antarctica]|uniref:Acyl-CoA synthetase (AMP-forming)/AMP-acid ligase II n=1 Tax=Zhongshania antarctica TaxID=641702 RepID=A0A840R968_9GAMM|nr:long-chain fatty acid--CoA ligase [Zhongshania antarctica]MBB5189006.1 acyl-CoA synthetase (AMP-forming)/AMP-acid ligase II [Zhongshania antarctica]